MRTTIRDNYTPELGQYHEQIIVDPTLRKTWLFDCDGVFTDITKITVVSERGESTEYAASQEWLTRELEALEAADVTLQDNIDAEAETREADDKTLQDNIDNEESDRIAADNEIWDEIEAIEAASDVVDIVGTYAELENYDTSALKDNDIIKVLADETHDDAIAYYRWNDSSDEFVFVGVEGPYYTASETDTLLDGKQDKLVAGSNIQIAADGKTISATDTTYTHFTGATASTDGVQGLVPAPVAGDEDKVLKGDGTWGTIQSAANTIFYMNASESGNTRHIYKNPDMTGLASSKDVFDANELGQVILRISTSATPDQYSDCYLQNAYKATGDYQLLFLDEKTYRSFDTTNITDTSFIYGARVLQSELTAGTNIQINGTTISATDTTYSAFTGATSLADGAAGLVPAPLTGDQDKYLKADGTWATVSSGATITHIYYHSYNLYSDSSYTNSLTYNDVYAMFQNGEVIVHGFGNAGLSELMVVGVDSQGSYIRLVDSYSSTDPVVYLIQYVNTQNLKWSTFRGTLQKKLTAGSNISISGTTISATNTTYSDFGGATSSVAGSAGLVPAPTTSDPDKFLKGDGTWANLPAANNISSNDWNALWQ